MTESIDNFKKRLADIREISTLPHVMMRIMEIVTDENSSAVDLAAEIAQDTSLTAKILKMVNSAYYGFYREIAEVSDAVVVLGFNEIRRLSLAISVLDKFGGKTEGHRVAFWNHSFACAAMSDILAKERRMEEQGAFTAGLLHDIGKSILDQYFNDMFVAVQERMLECSLPSHEVERDLYGFDHADVGYWLAERWNLPVTLGEAIRYHHRPESATEMPEMAQLVHLADILSNEFMELRAGATLEPGEAVEGEDGLDPGEKNNLLMRLEERIGDSPLIDIFI
jgi:putative nucleotidyltransferase with HDIG domain